MTTPRQLKVETATGVIYIVVDGAALNKPHGSVYVETEGFSGSALWYLNIYNEACVTPPWPGPDTERLITTAESLHLDVVPTRMTGTTHRRIAEIIQNAMAL